MALVNRLTRLVKADLHAVLDNIEEPKQVLKQAIREMEDELAATEHRIILCAHDQKSLIARIGELNDAIAEIDTQLDLCFDSNKDELAKSLIRRKLEAQILVKRQSSKHAANEEFLHEQRALFDENRATLDSLRQKASLFSQSSRPAGDVAARFDDISWTAREAHVGDDDIEIAFLREKDARTSS